MEGTVVLSVQNAKYVHASPAPWSLAGGIKTFAPGYTPAISSVLVVRSDHWRDTGREDFAGSDHLLRRIRIALHFHNNALHFFIIDLDIVPSTHCS